MADPGGKGPQPLQTHEKLLNHYRIVADNSVKYVSPDGLYGIQILQHSILAYVPPRTALGELMTLPRSPNRLHKGYPSPLLNPSTPSVSRSRRRRRSRRRSRRSGLLSRCTHHPVFIRLCLGPHRLGTFSHICRSDGQGVDISFTVCFFVCVFVRLRIYPPRIKQAASQARRFIGVQGTE